MNLTPEQAALVADRREYFTALLRLHEGKRAFFSGDHKLALGALTAANVRLRRTKLSLAILLLGIMPGLLLRAYDVRDRLVFRASTR
jgi:hypothetical protein